MKKIILHLAAVFFLTTACNQVEKNSKNTTITATDSSTKKIENDTNIPTAYCYASFTGKDSITMQLKIGDKSVTGNLMYKIYEKDSNTGTFDGVMNGDTLMGNYTFMSEGIISVREIAFIIKDGIALEGNGAIEEKDGKVVFKNRGAINFDKGISMKKINCIN